MDIQALGMKVATRKFKVCKDIGLTCPLAPGKEVSSLKGVGVRVRVRARAEV